MRHFVQPTVVLSHATSVFLKISHILEGEVSEKRFSFTCAKLLRETNFTCVTSLITLQSPATFPVMRLRNVSGFIHKWLSKWRQILQRNV